MTKCALETPPSPAAPSAALLSPMMAVYLTHREHLHQRQKANKANGTNKFFEPHLMSNPPPMAQQFLYDLRKMVAMARERIRTRRHIPRLHAIVESEDEGGSNGTNGRQVGGYSGRGGEEEEEERKGRGEEEQRKRTQKEPKKTEQYSEERQQNKTEQYSDKRQLQAKEESTKGTEMERRDDANEDGAMTQNEKQVMKVTSQNKVMSQQRDGEQDKREERRMTQLIDDGPVGKDVWKRIKQFSDLKQPRDNGKVERNRERMKQPLVSNNQNCDEVGRGMKQHKKDEKEGGDGGENAEERDFGKRGKKEEQEEEKAKLRHGRMKQQDNVEPMRQMEKGKQFSEERQPKGRRRDETKMDPNGEEGDKLKGTGEEEGKCEKQTKREQCKKEGQKEGSESLDIVEKDAKQLKSDVNAQNGFANAEKVGRTNGREPHEMRDTKEGIKREKERREPRESSEQLKQKEWEEEPKKTEEEKATGEREEAVNYGTLNSCCLSENEEPHPSSNSLNSTKGPNNEDAMEKREGKHQTEEDSVGSRTESGSTVIGNAIPSPRPIALGDAMRSPGSAVIGNTVPSSGSEIIEDVMRSPSATFRNKFNVNPGTTIENLSDDDTSTTSSSTSAREDDEREDDDLMNIRLKNTTEMDSRKFVGLSPVPANPPKIGQNCAPPQTQPLGHSRIPIGVASTSGGTNGSKLPRAMPLQSSSSPPKQRPATQPVEEGQKGRRKSLLQQPNGSISLNSMKRRAAANGGVLSSVASQPTENGPDDTRDDGPPVPKNNSRVPLNTLRSAIPTSIPCPTSYYPQHTSSWSTASSASFPSSSLSYVVSGPDNHFKKSLPRRKKLNTVANSGGALPFVTNGNGMGTNLKMPTMV